MVPKPAWFDDSKVAISNAPTCGINKDGLVQYEVDSTTGQRSETRIDDKLWQDANYIVEGNFNAGYVSQSAIQEAKKRKILVPQYFDRSSIVAAEKFVDHLSDFYLLSIGELVDKKWVTVRGGHGSPAADQRVGDVPYIKVSDLRAGKVNINPTNMIPLELAKKKFWRSSGSGLLAYDLISPERASKNIGEFCVLMPGQEQVVLTKEVIILRSTQNAPFDQYFLMWAMNLRIVREQWNRIVFMQTNREDVGKRYYEIVVPIPSSKKVGENVSTPFRDYYKELEIINQRFSDQLNASKFDYYPVAGITV